jgi:hypothetical protein
MTTDMDDALVIERAPPSQAIEVCMIDAASSAQSRCLVEKKFALKSNVIRSVQSSAA